jgi:hypothetical protein
MVGMVGRLSVARSFALQQGRLFSAQFPKVAVRLLEKTLRQQDFQGHYRPPIRTQGLKNADPPPT